MSALVIVFAILFIGAAAVAYGFYVQFSALKRKDDARQQEADTARTSGQKAQKELSDAREELTRKRTELAEAREKLNELRARQFKQRDTERKQKGSLEADLSDQLIVARRDLEDERARADVLAREVRGMEEEIVKLRDSQKRTEDALKAAQAAATRAAAAPAAAPVATPAPVVVAAPQKTDEELKARLDSLDRQLREARKKATEFEEELKRVRGKASTASRVQLLTKNELDLFKEKLVWSEKRVVELERLLFDNKIALPERPPAPQPKAPQVAPGILARETPNTSGEGVVAEAADYVPEAPAAEAAAEAPAAPAEAPADASTTPAAGTSAVPPLRRPKAAVEGEPAAAKAE